MGNEEGGREEGREGGREGRRSGDTGSKTGGVPLNAATKGKTKSINKILPSHPLLSLLPSLFPGGHMAASHTLVGACPFCSDPISLEASSSLMA